MILMPGYLELAHLGPPRDCSARTVSHDKLFLGQVLDPLSFQDGLETTHSAHQPRGATACSRPDAVGNRSRLSHCPRIRVVPINMLVNYSPKDSAQYKWVRGWHGEWRMKARSAFWPHEKLHHFFHTNDRASVEEDKTVVLEC